MTNGEFSLDINRPFIITLLSNVAVPSTCNGVNGDIIPIPTFPLS